MSYPLFLKASYLKLNVPKKLIWIILRALLSVSLLTVLVLKIPVHKAISCLSVYLLPFVLFSLASYLIGQTICSLKWRMLTKSLMPSITLNAKYFVSLYLVGIFFSMLFPSTIGGDVFRTWHFSKKTNKPSEAILTVLLERVTGGFGLISMFMAASFFINLRMINIPKNMYKYINIFSVILILGIVVCIFLIFVFKNNAFKGSIIRSLTFMKNAKRLGLNVLFAYLLSIVFYFFFIFAHYLLGLSLGLKVDFVYYMFFVSAIALISIIPLTISGLGLREGGYVFFLTLLGVSNQKALVFGMLWLIVLILGAALGGILYLLGICDNGAKTSTES